MRRRLLILFLAIALGLLPQPWYGSAPGQAQGTLVLLDRHGEPIDHLTDGNQVRLRYTLPEAAAQNTPVTFSLDAPGKQIAGCLIPAGSAQCETDPFPSLGWHWQSGGTASEQRTVTASAQGTGDLAALTVQVAARPVVMVHGFSSSWQAWQNYIGAQGYLASIGVPGFAVGDGQVVGVMNTGNIADPNLKTNTIAQNAAILGEYLANVKQVTGAEMVDLLAHSMGGMISRYYIDRVMAERDVAQLIMLGTPALGSECANLPAALGFYLPAVLEIRPSYAQEIFNPQITHRRGIAFYALAGVPIHDPVGSPCTDVPSDIVVSKQSVGAIQLNLTETSVLHPDLNLSPQVFSEYVAPLLQKLAGEFVDEPDPPAPLASGAIQNQFSRVYTGHLPPGGEQEITISIDAGVTVASFALYDTSHTLQTTVRGASGNVIELDAQKNGLIVIDNPETLVYLGYGFANPRPGAWRVLLQTTASTPPKGADYALSARFTGGAALQVEASALIPEVGETVQIRASLLSDGSPLPLASGEVVVRDPAGAVQVFELQSSGEQYQAAWPAALPGLYSLDVNVSAQAADGSTIDRAAHLTIEAQSPHQETRRWLALAGLGGCILLVIVIIVGSVAWLIARRKRTRSAA